MKIMRLVNNNRPEIGMIGKTLTKREQVINLDDFYNE
jgi:hypothetical protein